jgi:hypothetical protein
MLLTDDGVRALKRGDTVEVRGKHDLPWTPATVGVDGLRVDGPDGPAPAVLVKAEAHGTMLVGRGQLRVVRPLETETTDKCPRCRTVSGFTRSGSCGNHRTGSRTVCLSCRAEVGHRNKCHHCGNEK